MDLQVMKYFKTIADTGSFTAASEQLHYAQSNLSTQIMKLEEELETQLLYRHKRGVSLTSDGSLFYDYVSDILRMVDEAALSLKDMDTARGNLRLGSIEATALNDLPRIIGDYHLKYPAVHISLETDLNDFFQSRVLDHKLDGAFVEGPVDHPELEEIVLKREKLVLVGSSYEEDLTAEEILREKELITFPEGSSFRRRMERLLVSRSIAYSDRLTIINSLGAMITNIAAGLGFGYLPESIVTEYIGTDLMTIYPLEDPYSEFDVVFAYRKDHIRTAAFRFFIDVVQNSPKVYN
ncbi:MAG: LysR family transcriptional regulator [Firmicutes bacterium]|nr:LysR family transcriptional regulator [Bacillota bacterium]